jgi:hypothetical protein
VCYKISSAPFGLYQTICFEIQSYIIVHIFDRFVTIYFIYSHVNHINIHNKPEIRSEITTAGNATEVSAGLLHCMGIENFDPSSTEARYGSLFVMRSFCCLAIKEVLRSCVLPRQKSQRFPNTVCKGLCSMRMNLTQYEEKEKKCVKQQ